MWTTINNCWRNSVGRDYLFIALNIGSVFLSLTAYVINQYYLKINYQNIIFSSFWNDFCAGVFILSYSNILLSFYKYRNIKLDTLTKIIGFSLIVASYWEYITPLYNKSSISDPLDILMYTLGALFYYFTVIACFYAVL